MLIIIMMAFVVYIDYDLDEMTVQLGYGNYLSWLLIRILCFVQFGLTLFYTTLWWKMKSNVALRKY
jgi:hypothetical protein